jgi:hypothetical protein
MLCSITQPARVESSRSAIHDPAPDAHANDVGLPGVLRRVHTAPIPVENVPTCIRREPRKHPRMPLDVAHASSDSAST